MSVSQTILLANDDGYFAKGIQCLFAALSEQHRCYLVAPDRECSGTSQSLTLHRPLTVRRISTHQFAVEGTPADCVNLATTGLIDEPIDTLISGINLGANLGDDLLYSGTVAAMLEGRFAARRLLAVSLDGSQHIETAVKAVQQLIALPLPEDGPWLLNVNVPDLPWSQIRGFKTTRVGQRHAPQPALRQLDPRGRPHWWIGKVGQGQGEDFDALAQGFISVSPIRVQFTEESQLSALSTWLGALS